MSIENFGSLKKYDDYDPSKIRLISLDGPFHIDNELIKSQCTCELKKLYQHVPMTGCSYFQIGCTCSNYIRLYQSSMPMAYSNINTISQLLHMYNQGITGDFRLTATIESHDKNSSEN